MLCWWKKAILYKLGNGPVKESVLVIRNLVYRPNAKHGGLPTFNANVKVKVYLLVDRKKWVAASDYIERVDSGVSHSSPTITPCCTSPIILLISFHFYLEWKLPTSDDEIQEGSDVKGSRVPAHGNNSDDMNEQEYEPDFDLLVSYSQSSSNSFSLCL